MVKKKVSKKKAIDINTILLIIVIILLIMLVWGVFFKNSIVNIANEGELKSLIEDLRTIPGDEIRKIKLPYYPGEHWIPVDIDCNGIGENYKECWYCVGDHDYCLALFEPPPAGAPSPQPGPGGPNDAPKEEERWAGVEPLEEDMLA